MPDQIMTAHFAPAGAAAGSEAACGYILTGVSGAGVPECARCIELISAPSTGAMLTSLRRHEHEWESAGAVLRPGWWLPVWRCTICADEVADLGMRRRSVEVGT